MAQQPEQSDDDSDSDDEPKQKRKRNKAKNKGVHKISKRGGASNPAFFADL